MKNKSKSQHSRKKSQLQILYVNYFSMSIRKHFFFNKTLWKKHTHYRILASIWQLFATLLLRIYLLFLKKKDLYLCECMFTRKENKYQRFFCTWQFAQFFLFCVNVVAWFFPSAPKHFLETFFLDVGFFQTSN